MQRWYTELPASLLMSAERDQVDQVLSHILGEQLLQVGGPHEFSLASPVRHKVYCANYLEPKVPNQSGIVADLEQLPVLPGSIDVFLLVHALEVVSQPQQLLQQVYDILAPGGQLIIVGFNALSLWGLTHLWKNKQKSPWRGHFFMPWQVRHWLRNIGLRIVSSETFYFRPPLQQAKWQQRMLWFEGVGQVCFPGCGAAFLISAQKRESGMTPIKAKWWERKWVANNGYAEPTTRVKG